MKNKENTKNKIWYKIIHLHVPGILALIIILIKKNLQSMTTKCTKIL